MAAQHLPVRGHKFRPALLTGPLGPPWTSPALQPSARNPLSAPLRHPLPFLHARPVTALHATRIPLGPSGHRPPASLARLSATTATCASAAASRTTTDCACAVCRWQSQRCGSQQALGLHGATHASADAGFVRSLRGQSTLTGWRRGVAAKGPAAAAAGRSVGGLKGGPGAVPRQPALVVVESPTKAKKIQEFLGSGYKVLASYGHIRDLPSREGAVQPDRDFDLTWRLLPAARQRVDEIAAAAAGSPLVLLATDPDREGEAISWHIQEELRLRGVLERAGAVQRITFTEVTKAAVTAAIAGGRQVSAALVDAYLARRALDYLVGFNLSGVLWRRVPGARSAGRVQSVALRLVCEREAEVERFTRTPYWSITSQLQPQGQEQGQGQGGAAPLTARLTHVDGRRLGPLGVSSGEQAEELARRIRSGPVVVSKVLSRQQQRHPSPPFTTSTLQQEASRRLGFGAARTMRVAQQLYEGAGTGEGLITYMRTDGVSMSGGAVQEVRRANVKLFGKEAVPEAPRQYKSRAKNAQEAHEAIRPTRPSALPPSALPASLDADQRALYELIWARAAASQMTSAVYDVVSAELAADGGRLTLRASGSVLRHPGFLWAYDDQLGEQQEGAQEGEGRAAGGAEAGDEDGVSAGRENQGRAAEQLLRLQEGSLLAPSAVQPQSHWTRPPPRYTEASLVRALEDRGIGRPSTYASIMTLLQRRGYVSREGRSLLPTSLGRVLTAFLERYFGTYVDYSFTCDLEGQLDEIASGRAAWKALLRSFWGPFHSSVTAMSAIRTTEVYDMLDSALDSYLFPQPQQQEQALLQNPNSRGGQVIDVMAATVAVEASGYDSDSAAVAVADPRVCPRCARGRLVLKPSRYGGFIGCSLYGDEAVKCGYSRPLLPVTSDSGDTDSDSREGPSAAANAIERLLGHHPETGEPVTVRLGPYGLYVQLGGLEKETGSTPAPGAAAAPATEAKGTEPDEEEVAATGKAKGKAKGKGKGKGKAVRVKAPPKPKRVSVPKAQGLTLHTVSLGAALALLALPRTLGPHPGDGQPVIANTGPFGPYVMHGGVSASLGSRSTPQDVDLATAVQLLDAKRLRQADREARGLPPLGRGKRLALSGPAAAKAKLGGYTAFLRHRWQSIKAADPTAVYLQTQKQIAAEWRELTPQQQSQFIQEAAAAAAAAASKMEAEAEEGSAAEAGGVEEEATPLRQTGAKSYSRSTTSSSSTRGSRSSRTKAKASSAPASRRSSASSSVAVLEAPAKKKTRAKSASSSASSSPSPLNPFISFCNVQRPALRVAHPEAGLGQLSKMLGAAWKALSPEEKAAYSQ